MIYYQKSSNIIILIVVVIILITITINVKSQPDQNTNFDALFRELNILTRQQLQQLQASSPTLNKNGTSSTITTIKTSQIRHIELKEIEYFEDHEYKIHWRNNFLIMISERRQYTQCLYVYQFESDSIINQ